MKPITEVKKELKNLGPVGVRMSYLSPANGKKEEPEKVETPADPTPETVAEKPAETTETPTENAPDFSELTTKNVMDYRDAIYSLALSDRHNPGLIMSAIIENDLDTPEILFNYARSGVLPDFHTFDAWKKSGYIVRKGEKARFSAYIWKSVVKKSDPLTEKDAQELNNIIHDGTEYKAGDRTETSKFIKKLAFFFGPDQVDKIPSDPVELPDDCNLEKRGNAEIITGNTKPIKETLKKAGYSWHKKTASWIRYTA